MHPTGRLALEPLGNRVLPLGQIAHMLYNASVKEFLKCRVAV